MNCKDLTICDFVKHDGTIKIVDAIYLYSVSVHDPSKPWGVASSELVHVDDIEPIKFTEEILVKNGFYRSPRWHYCEITTDDGFKIYVQLGCGGTIDYVRITKHNSDLMERDLDVTVSIHYVHELQHLLRLCGVEKEIEL